MPSDTGVGRDGSDAALPPSDVIALDAPGSDVMAADAPAIDTGSADVPVAPDVTAMDVPTDRPSVTPDVIRRDVPITTGCAAESDCATGLACSIDACGTRGTCVAMARCSAIFMPVCGCDGMTYSNDCVRTNASVGLAHTGACTDGGTAMCTVPRGCCARDADCGRLSYCVNVGSSCTPGSASTGVCKTRPINPAQCWRDSDCVAGGTCTGERICPCTAMCILPDAPGTCG